MKGIIGCNRENVCLYYSWYRLQLRRYIVKRNEDNMSKVDSLFDALQRLKNRGFFQIFSATIINSIISFVHGMFIVRILTKSQYGLFSYAQ